MIDSTHEYEAIPVNDSHRDDAIARSRRPSETIEDIVSSAREFATKIPATIGRAIERAVQAGEHAILVKVDDEMLKKIEMLVKAGVYKSRPDAVVFLIGEGIKSQQAMFDRIQEKEAEIERLRAEMRSIAAQ